MITCLAAFDPLTFLLLPEKKLFLYILRKGFQYFIISSKAVAHRKRCILSLNELCLIFNVLSSHDG